MWIFVLLNSNITIIGIRKNQLICISTICVLFYSYIGKNVLNLTYNVWDISFEKKWTYVLHKITKFHLNINV